MGISNRVAARQNFWRVTRVAHCRWSDESLLKGFVDGSTFHCNDEVVSGYF